jgi:hypothetical protein
MTLADRGRRLLRTLAWWVLGNVRPLETEIDAALKGAFADCGLPAASYHPECDVLRTGKLHEVLVHASRRLGNPLVTVDDLRELLS